MVITDLSTAPYETYLSRLVARRFDSAPANHLVVS
jgi:hypothetical protein